MIGVEHCERCGFERGEWNEQDAQRTLAHADTLLAGWSVDATGHLDHKLTERRLDDVAAIQAADDLFDKVHHLMHGLCSIADVRRAAGDAVEHQVGAVVQINRSGGGVPKLPIADGQAVTIGRRGVEGDVQATRLHHGRPWQALCLWSAEAAAELAAAGHPIAAGAVGENLTVSGVDWASLRGGTVIEVGSGDDAVRCQLSAPAVPCQKNARWFTDGDISRLDHDLHPGWSRWYASVLRPGSIRTGDPFVVSPR